MYIVVTHDESIRNWAKSKDSGAEAWQNINLLGLMDQAPDDNLKELLGKVAADEPLCISGHGNDKEIGDEKDREFDWAWDTAQLASLLGECLTAGFKAPILIDSCGAINKSFVGKLALELQELKKLKSIWIFGYQKKVDSDKKCPAPDLDALHKQADLTGVQVRF